MDVWIVIEWEFGGGGDDTTTILGVFASEEGANTEAAKHERAEVERHEVQANPDPSADHTAPAITYTPSLIVDTSPEAMERTKRARETLNEMCKPRKPS